MERELEYGYYLLVAGLLLVTRPRHVLVVILLPSNLRGRRTYVPLLDDELLLGLLHTLHFSHDAQFLHVCGEV